MLQYRHIFKHAPMSMEIITQNTIYYVHTRLAPIWYILFMKENHQR